VVLYYAGWSIWPATLLAVGVGFAFRLVALFRRWEEPEPYEPAEAHAGEQARRPLGEAIDEELHAT
jgi:hypothetical protein